MALTFDHAIQRSLAAHVPPESLAAAARPLRHEIRTDAPMGVISQLMRVVDGAGAMDAATFSAGPDLVLRPRRLSSSDLAADVADGVVGTGPRVDPSALGPSALGPSALGPSALGPNATGRGAEVVARVAEPAGEVSIHATDGSRAASSVTPDGADGSAALSPSLVSSAPTLADAPPMIEQTPQGQTAEVAAPLRSLAVASAPPAEQLDRPRSLTLAPPIARVSGSAASDSASAVPSTITRSAESVAAPPVRSSAVVRRRHVVEVKSAAEPVRPAAFRSADVAVDPRSEELAAEDVAPVESTVAGPSAVGSAPTLGRRRGLGLPMESLPATAVAAQRDEDPFAAWRLADDDDAPLRLVSSPPATHLESGGDRGGASAPIGSSEVVPTARRGADAEPSTTGSTSVPERPGGAAESGRDSPMLASAMTVQLIAGPPSAPMLGSQHLHRAVDDRSPVSIGGDVTEVTSVVPVRWLVGGQAPGAGRPQSGSSAHAAGGAAVARSADGIGGGHAGDTGPFDRSVAGRSAGSALDASVAAGPVHRATVDVTSSGQRAPADPAALTAPLVAGPVSVGSFDVGSRASFDGGSLLRRLPASEAPGTRRDVVSDAISDVVSASAGASGETPVVPLSPVKTTPSGRFMPSISSSDVAPSTASTASSESGADGSAPLPVASIGSASTRSSGVASSESLSALSSAGSSGLIGRQSDAASTAPTPGASGATEAGLSGEWSTDSGFDADSPFIYRESDDGAAGGAPSAATGTAGAAGGPAAGGASGAGPSDAELDKLAGRLYERLRHKLRRELLDDRERAGFALDRVR